MDLPWNPALLEQRIARIHRMGQVRPVQIVNFVSKGTIEESMQSVLKFKRSLSAGILDGGNGEVAMGGSRLTRFMKDVEGVTGRIAEGEAMTPAEEEAASATVSPAKAADESATADDSLEEAGAAGAAGEPRSDNGDAWAALLQVGSQLLSALAQPNPASGTSHPWIERDAKTGAGSLRIPLPPPDAARKLADALSGLAGLVRGAS